MPIKNCDKNIFRFYGCSIKYLWDTLYYIFKAFDQPENYLLTIIWKKNNKNQVFMYRKWKCHVTNIYFLSYTKKTITNVFKNCWGF